jgi:hypothetical protein
MSRRLYFSSPNAFSCHRLEGKYQRLNFSLSPPLSPPRPVTEIDISQSEYEGLLFYVRREEEPRESSG